MTPDLPDIAVLRGQVKQVRFCPSCGFRRLDSKALHHSCAVCGWSFVVLEASAIDGVASVGLLGETASFAVKGKLSVPVGRSGVRKLIDDTTREEPNIYTVPEDPDADRFDGT